MHPSGGGSREKAIHTEVISPHLRPVYPDHSALLRGAILNAKHVLFVSNFTKSLLSLRLAPQTSYKLASQDLLITAAARQAPIAQAVRY